MPWHASGYVGLRQRIFRRLLILSYEPDGVPARHQANIRSPASRRHVLRDAARTENLVAAYRLRRQVRGIHAGREIKVRYGASVLEMVDVLNDIGLRCSGGADDGVPSLILVLGNIALLQYGAAILLNGDIVNSGAANGLHSIVVIELDVRRSAPVGIPGYVEGDVQRARDGNVNASLRSQWSALPVGNRARVQGLLQ